MNLSLSGSVAFTAPGGGAGSLTLSSTATYTAQQNGSIDIPSGTASGTAFQLPFGSVAAAKGFGYKSMANVKLALNGATGAAFNVPTGGVGFNMFPVPGASQQLSSAVIVTIETAQSGVQFDFEIFGD